MLVIHWSLFSRSLGPMLACLYSWAVFFTVGPVHKPPWGGDQVSLILTVPKRCLACTLKAAPEVILLLDDDGAREEGVGSWMWLIVSPRCSIIYCCQSSM